jgi:hypothetical protein
VFALGSSYAVHSVIDTLKRPDTMENWRKRGLIAARRAKSVFQQIDGARPIHLVPAWGNKEALSLSERADGALLPASTEIQHFE